MSEDSFNKHVPPPLPPQQQAGAQPADAAGPGQTPGESNGNSSTPPVAETAAELPPDSAEARIAQFLDRAGAVLALERGINARSRVKLAAVADEVGLSDDELAQAMMQLQRGKPDKVKEVSPDELRKLRRQKRAYHDYVGQTLMALPQGVLTSSMEEMLVSAGVDEHGLSADDSHTELRGLVEKLRIRRITREEATRHIGELVDAKIRPDGTLDNSVRQRILAEGSRWGLTPDEVDPLIKCRLSRVRMGQKREEMRNVLLISGSAAVLVGVLGMISWMALSSSLPTVKDDDPDPPDGWPTTVAATAETHDGSASPPAVTATPAVPDWWDTEMAAYVAIVRGRLPEFQAELVAIRSPAAAERAQGYAGVIKKTVERASSDQHLAVLTNLLAAAYVLEPADQCAARIRSELMRVAAEPGEKLPPTAAPYRMSLWAAETAGAALLDPDLATARRQSLQTDLENTLQASIAADASPLELQRAVLAAAATHVYRTLTLAARQDVNRAIDLHEAVADLIQDHLNTAAEDRLATDFLAAMLPELGDRWVRYDALARRAVQSEDPLNVLKMLDVFEQTDQATLQEFLAAQLALRVGASPVKSREEIAAAVRTALGAAEIRRPVDSTLRVSQWNKRVDEALAERPTAADKPEALLPQVLQMTWLATLGMALSGGELSAPDFDELWEQQPPTLSARSAFSTGPSGTTGTASRRISTTQMKTLDRWLTALRNFDRTDKLQRLAYARNVSGYAGLLSDIQPEQGQAIAAYLAAAKPVDEHEQLMSFVDNLLRWRAVRLGLADHIEDSRLRSEHMQQLLEAALHRKVAMDDGWKLELRKELLANVASEFAAESRIATDSESIYDRAAKEMTRLYRRQVKLSGGGAAPAGAAELPSDAIRAVIDQTAARLSAGAAEPMRLLLDRVQHEIAAVDYLTADDLARSVALLRLLAEVQAAETIALTPAKRTAVEAIQSQARARDAAAPHVLEQLEAAQRTLVELWRVRLS